MRTPEELPVVVGVSGAAAGLAAARLGAREAVTRGRRLRVINAFADEHDFVAGRRRATAVVNEAVAAARESAPRLRITGEVVDGAAVRVLLQQSRAAEVLVLGGVALADGPRFSPDSVLRQIIARAWCPVAVVRGPRPPSGPLLVAIDGSAAAFFALRHAAFESQRRGLGLEVVHVVAEPDAAAEAAGRRLLAEAIGAVPGLAARARSRMLTGDPATALIRASRQARMVIVGSRGVSGLQPGSVALALLRGCACPTVFVHGSTAVEHHSTGTVPSMGVLAS
jgi:nucleotide-binding universal stress UspA family protein